MVNNSEPLWYRILRSVVYYLWLALGPELKRTVLRMDASAENHAHADENNNLKNHTPPKKA